MTKKVRHVLGISGGKDSAALAIYLKQKNKVPDIEYFFLFSVYCILLCDKFI
jgi:tRNA(Ile)-lysidine synthase TilS/MesJ